MESIDLRSDTVTHPTPEMREAMANAIVGDDVYGEDPLVNQLEAEAAETLGKEAGLFVSSGTQGNLIALLTHCERGAEIIVGDKAHTFKFEAGGMAALGGIIPHIVPVQDDGTLNLDDIRSAIRGDNYHFPPTRLVAIENTQGTVGGVPVTVDYTNQVAQIAQEHGLKFHIDGARIFNASTALNTSVNDLIEQADSMTFCLSKGLCAPVGSILVGSRAFIDQARRMRKILGGGMRQAGILASAGLIALHKMSKRLQEDHDNATLLAEGLSAIDGIQVKHQHTNFVFFDLAESVSVSPEDFVRVLQADYNIIMRPYPGFKHTFRCVTHYWISRERVETVIQAVQEVVA